MSLVEKKWKLYCLLWFKERKFHLTAWSFGLGYEQTREHISKINSQGFSAMCPAPCIWEEIQWTNGSSKIFRKTNKGGEIPWWLHTVWIYCEFLCPKLWLLWQMMEQGCNIHSLLVCCQILLTVVKVVISSPLKTCHFCSSLVHVKSSGTSVASSCMKSRSWNNNAANMFTETTNTRLYWKHFDYNEKDEKEKNLGPSNRLFSRETPQCFGLSVFKMTVLVGTLYFNPEKVNTSQLKYWPSGIVINRVFIDVKRNLCNYLSLKSVKSQTVCRIIFIEDIDHFAAIAKHVD